MTTTIPHPLLLTSLLSGASVFAALDQRRRWDGNGVAVVDKAGRTAVDRDKHNCATRCDNDNNHPYPIVADVVIIWRLCLCGNGMVVAAAGWQQGGKDRGSGRHSPAVLGRAISLSRSRFCTPQKYKEKNSKVGNYPLPNFYVECVLKLKWCGWRDSFPPSSWSPFWEGIRGNKTLYVRTLTKH